MPCALAQEGEQWDDIDGITYGLTALMTLKGAGWSGNGVLVSCRKILATRQGEPLPGTERICGLPSWGIVLRLPITTVIL